MALDWGLSFEARRTWVLALTLVATMVLVACAKPEAHVREAVLTPGDGVRATNRSGTVEISYVSPTERRYQWDGASRVVKMIPRDKPFRGVLGLYEPANAPIGDENVRLVVQESKIYFSNYEELYSFLRQSSGVMDWVYTSDGLVVGYSKSASRNQINLDLWQLFVGGKKPSDLRGARDEDIHRVSPTS